MNCGINIIRHKGLSEWPKDARPGELYASYDAWGKVSDEELKAFVLCQQKHDDERTALAAQDCLTIHVSPPFTELAEGHLLMEPDPRCVELRAAALRKWNGIEEPEAAGEILKHANAV